MSLRAELMTAIERAIQIRLVGWSWTPEQDRTFPINPQDIADKAASGVKPFPEDPQSDGQLAQTFRLDRQLSPIYGKAYLIMLAELDRKYSDAPF